MCIILYTTVTGQEQDYTAVDSGDQPYLSTLQANCPAKLKLKLKIGAQVVFIVNFESR